MGRPKKTQPEPAEVVKPLVVSPPVVKAAKVAPATDGDADFKRDVRAVVKPGPEVTFHADSADQATHWSGLVSEVGAEDGIHYETSAAGSRLTVRHAGRV